MVKSRSLHQAPGKLPSCCCQLVSVGTSILFPQFNTIEFCYWQYKNMRPVLQVSFRFLNVLNSISGQNIHLKTILHENQATSGRNRFILDSYPLFKICGFFFLFFLLLKYFLNIFWNKREWHFPLFYQSRTQKWVLITSQCNVYLLIIDWMVTETRESFSF